MKAYRREHGPTWKARLAADWRRKRDLPGPLIDARPIVGPMAIFNVFFEPTKPGA